MPRTSRPICRSAATVIGLPDGRAGVAASELRPADLTGEVDTEPRADLTGVVDSEPRAGGVDSEGRPRTGVVGTEVRDDTGDVDSEGRPRTGEVDTEVRGCTGGV